MPLAALWLLSASASAATIYKWVDENGVVHYSDQPHPKAQEITVAPAQTYTAPPSPAARDGNQTTSGPEYRACEIIRPEKDEVFLNTSTLTATVRMEPALAPTHRIVLTLDGKRLTNQPPTGRTFVLSAMERGTHSLTMVVEDNTGKAVCNSAPVQFHVRQPSVQAPVKAVRPKF
jgi:hypothetical protein